jgi:hypothetical protein
MRRGILAERHTCLASLITPFIASVPIKNQDESRISKMSGKVRTSAGKPNDLKSTVTSIN